MGSFGDKLVTAGVVRADEVANAEARAKRDQAAAETQRRRAELAAIRERRDRECAPFRVASTTPAPDLVETWREFEQRLVALGFAWALHPNSADVRWARARAMTVAGWDQGFPASYRTFIEQVGYPSLGFRYYCRDGFSFLPPQPMAAVSVDVSDDELEAGGRIAASEKPCRYRLFAGIELSDIDGWAFSTDPRDPPGIVWRVVGAMVHEPLGPFDAWLTQKLARVVAQMEATPPEQRAELERAHDPDPHRILNYSTDPGKLRSRRTLP